MTKKAKGINILEPIASSDKIIIVMVHMNTMIID